MIEKKYRVCGTGIHAISLTIKSKERRKKDVFWFDTLDEAKVQVMKNNQAFIDGFLIERDRAIKRLETINENVAIASQPLNLDVVTDDYLINQNKRFDELESRLHSGNTEWIF